MCFYYYVICNYYTLMGETARKRLAVKTSSLRSSNFLGLVEFHSLGLFFHELSCQLKKRVNYHEAYQTDAKLNIPSHYPQALLCRGPQSDLNTD